MESTTLNIYHVHYGWAIQITVPAFGVMKEEDIVADLAKKIKLPKDKFSVMKQDGSIISGSKVVNGIDDDDYLFFFHHEDDKSMI